MSELFEHGPVATIRKRNFYKTEFDIFKQNTDIDLISLISYDDYVSDLEPFGYSREDNVAKKVRNTENNYKELNKDKGVTKTVRTTLIERQNRENPRIRGILQRERACKSAVNFKGNYSRNRCVTQRSQTAKGSRIAVREIKYSSRDCVTKENQFNTYTRYRNCYGARQTTVGKGHNAIVRSATAYGYSNANTFSHQTFIGRKTTKTSTVKCTDRPKTVTGTRNLQKDHLCTKYSDYETGATNCFEKHSVSDNEYQPRTSDKNVCNSVRTVENFEGDDTRYEVQSNHQLTSLVKDSDSCDSAKHEECFNSKDSGYHSSLSTPDLIKTKTCRDLDSKLIEKPETIRLGSENGSSKKHVTFNVDFDKESDVSNVADVDDGSSTSESIASDIDDGADKSDTGFDDDVYNFQCLLTDLEQSNQNGRSSEIKIESDSLVESDNNSLCSIYNSELQTQSGTNILRQEKQQLNSAKGNQESLVERDIIHDIAMSREARYAIIETLQDMKGKRSDNRAYRFTDKENSSASILHRNVGQQNRQRENRNKYNQYMRERTNITYGTNVSRNNTKNRFHGSVYSSDVQSGDSDASDDSKEGNVKTNLLPAIGNVQSQTDHPSKTKIYSLEQAKRKKYKIPGIGNFDLVMSPESEFEITPPGFDSRYDPRPVITKDEIEPPPKVIQERSIQKCKKWLKNVNLSPLSLNPILKRRESSTNS